MHGVSVRTRIVAAFGGWLGRIRRPVTMGVRAIVRDAQGHVLLVRHTYVPGWYLPGGGVEPGESASESLARELMEEANISIAQAPRLVGLYFNPRGGSDHVALYEVTRFEQVSAKQPDREIAEARFFPPDALPETITPATRARLLGDGNESDRW